jgi:hypothetical protein
MHELVGLHTRLAFCSCPSGSVWDWRSSCCLIKITFGVLRLTDEINNRKGFVSVQGLG